MDTDLLPGGTHVEFDPFDGDTGFKLSGVILRYLPPDDEGFVGAYHVACYYGVHPDDVRVIEEVDPELLGTLPMVRNLIDKTGLDYHTVFELLRKGWQYIEEEHRIPRWDHPMGHTLQRPPV